MRCAIYTRKSTDEGLEEEFNSLDQQRQSCAAYVESQRHEGWRLLDTTYDDGGFSGGNMRRPALQRLLQAVADGLVDIIVVYKIDRLTRSLMDFARIVEALDARSASFVSVTQSFNTTTSVGRLTLNMLLSFAQFEREVTSERIRDKISASKAKGMWMGGLPPMGYDVSNRSLVVNPSEARTVRQLFQLYLKLKSVERLQEEAARLGLLSKRRHSIRGVSGGGPLSRNGLYHLLGNPLYVGLVRHKDVLYPGRHEAIVETAEFEAAAAVLARQRRLRRTGETMKEPSLLPRRVFDESGKRFTPTGADRHGRRYRYYMAPREAGRPRVYLPAKGLEGAVINTLVRHLIEPHHRIALFRASGAGDLSVTSERMSVWLEKLQASTPSIVRTALADLAVTVIYSRETLRIRFDLVALVGEPKASPRIHEIGCAINLRRLRLNYAVMLDTDGFRAAAPDPALVRLLAKASGWLARLLDGEASSIADLARQVGVTPRYVEQVIELGLLAPDLQLQILRGRQPSGLTARELLAMCPLPSDWERQRAIFETKAQPDPPHAGASTPDIPS
ncbi:recombinase family protein [Brevundimonas sp. BR2-1]|uniref:recombinase family protein n=1 Tax=Brevundimonas sp. BR2-1 TaxID=3031123 RepID=UPI0030B41355